MNKYLNYIIWLAVIVLYTPVFKDLYSVRWDTVDYTHAFFILPISLWLTWRMRKELKESHTLSDPGNRSIFSLPILIFGLALFIFGWQQDYLFILTFSLIPLLLGLTLYLYGKEIAKKLSFPVLYLLLLVPPPFGILDSITLPMRHGISALTEKILFFAGYPITRNGLLLTIGYNDIFMGAPCSGFRSLITMFSLVFVYVYIINGNMAKKMTLTAFIIPFALLGNLIRVITLCLITFYFGEEVGQGFFHNFSGIVIFIITILGLMGAESLIDRTQSNKG